MKTKTEDVTESLVRALLESETVNAQIMRHEAMTAYVRARFTGEPEESAKPKRKWKLSAKGRRAIAAAARRRWRKKAAKTKKH